MHGKVQNDPSAEHFAIQLLDIGNEKMTIEETTGCIILSIDFYCITHSQKELVYCVL